MSEKMEKSNEMNAEPKKKKTATRANGSYLRQHIVVMNKFLGFLIAGKFICMCMLVSECALNEYVLCLCAFYLFAFKSNRFSYTTAIALDNSTNGSMFHFQIEFFFSHSFDSFHFAIDCRNCLIYIVQ